MPSLKPQKVSKNSIGSISSLSKVLSIPTTELLEIRESGPEERYTWRSIPKAGGSERVVYNPSFKIRLVQHRINTRIFKKLVEWPEYLYGSLPNQMYLADGQSKAHVHRDYVACAKNHCGAKSILKLDISDFFENIHRETVHEVFSGFFDFPDDVAECLTDLCCFGDSLVQGALTSSYIAMLCLWNVEHKVVARLAKRNLAYTRLVDDITVSSKRRGYDFVNAESHIKNMLLMKDLPINQSKTKVLRAGTESLRVHGLVVDFATPRLPSSEVSKIRASVNNIVNSATSNNFRTTFTYREQYYRCLGRVNLLARVGHNKHKVFLNKLKKVKPLPSRLDFEKVRNSIDKIRNRRDKSSVEYSRLYNIARFRIQIIARTFEKEANELLSELKKEVKPAKPLD